MVTVTERAREELGSILAAASIAGPEVGLRLTTTAPGQFNLTTDTEREADRVVEHEGSKVLLVGTELTEFLEGVTIDCQDSPEGPHLVMMKD